MYDAIVVGARCAGSPTAMLLARKGYRVLVVDRTSFPSDKISTHNITSVGLLHLRAWGLLDQVAATNCPPIRHVTSDFGDGPLSGTVPLVDGLEAAAYCVRRTALDTLLVEAAAQAGADVREQFIVDEILIEDGRVVGIQGRGSAGTLRAHAPIVIGADGMRSMVARAVQAPLYNTRPPRACYYYTYWSDVGAQGLELYRYGRRVIFVVPTNDGCACVLIGWPHDEFQQVRADYEASYLRAIAAVPQLAARIDKAQRAGRYIGTADVPNFFRRPHGPGWALVGDAGYHRDPFTAQGISDAFRDAQLLADAIDCALAGKQPIASALADYERRRNAAVASIYEMTCRMAGLEPPSTWELSIRAALRGNQAEIDRYSGVIIGTVPYEAFYTPQNIRRMTDISQSRVLAA